MRYIYVCLPNALLWMWVIGDVFVSILARDDVMSFDWAKLTTYSSKWHKIRYLFTNHGPLYMVYNHIVHMLSLRFYDSDQANNNNSRKKKTKKTKKQQQQKNNKKKKTKKKKQQQKTTYIWAETSANLPLKCVVPGYEDQHHFLPWSKDECHLDEWSVLARR